jgi:hypothetical protein
MVVMPYVIFAGSQEGDLFDKKVGYLESLQNRGIIADLVVSRKILKSGDTGPFSHIYEDEGMREALKRMDLPEIFFVSKAKVVDREGLDLLATELFETYGMRYEICEVEKRLSPKQ